MRTCVASDVLGWHFDVCVDESPSLSVGSVHCVFVSLRLRVGCLFGSLTIRFSCDGPCEEERHLCGSAPLGFFKLWSRRSSGPFDSAKSAQMALWGRCNISTAAACQQQGPSMTRLSCFIVAVNDLPDL